MVQTAELHALRTGVRRVKDGAEARNFLFARGSYADRDMTDLPKMALLDLRLPKIPEDRDIAESYQLGANRFVSKPVEFDEIAKVVAKLGLYRVLINQGPV